VDSRSPFRYGRTSKQVNKLAKRKIKRWSDRLGRSALTFFPLLKKSKLALNVDPFVVMQRRDPAILNSQFLFRNAFVARPSPLLKRRIITKSRSRSLLSRRISAASRLSVSSIIYARSFFFLRRREFRKTVRRAVLDEIDQGCCEWDRAFSRYRGNSQRESADDHSLVSTIYIYIYIVYVYHYGLTNARVTCNGDRYRSVTIREYQRCRLLIAQLNSRFARGLKNSTSLRQLLFTDF